MEKSNIVHFKEELKRFQEDVNLLIENSSLSTKEDFLSRVAEDVNNLYACAMQIINSKNEDIEEIGSIIQNIFMQPLKTETKNITFLTATKEYPQGNRSDLSEIMRQYVKYPETTKSFARELELLTKDIESALKNIA